MVDPAPLSNEASAGPASEVRQDWAAASLYSRPRYAAGYDEDRFGGTFGAYLENLEVEGFLSLLEEADVSILDVGAGTGKLTLPLLRQGRQVLSVDASLEMLNVAAKKAYAEGLVLSPMVGDVHRLQFPNESFDCVVSSRVLMHLADWRLAVAEMCRVSRRSVLIDFPPLMGSGGFGASIRWLQKRLLSDVQTYRVFRVGSVVRELHRNRFRTVKVERHFVLPLGLHRLIDHPAFSRRMEQRLRQAGLANLLGAPAKIKAVRIAE